MDELLQKIRACEICKPSLPLGPNPVVRASSKSKILVIGQAPGTKVHQSGIPWNDASGKNLRKWLGVTDDEFYNPELFAIVPMGFCFPGYDSRKADLPPPAVCGQTWHARVLAHLPWVWPCRQQSACAPRRLRSRWGPH